MNHFRGLDKAVQLAWVEVEKIERSNDDKRKVTIIAPHDRYTIELEDAVARKLRIGDCLIAGFRKYYSPFIIFSDHGSDEGDIYTISQVLDSLRIPDSDYIYQREYKQDKD
jgi:hypothetical protein